MIFKVPFNMSHSMIKLGCNIEYIQKQYCLPRDSDIWFA